MQTERTALYRLFDADEKLLYIGISRDPKIRWRQHRRWSAWSTQVAMRVIEWHDSRTAALLAELRAIRTERPRHNVQHRPRPKVRRTKAATGVSTGKAERITPTEIARRVVALGYAPP